MSTFRKIGNLTINTINMRKARTSDSLVFVARRGAAEVLKDRAGIVITALGGYDAHADRYNRAIAASKCDPSELEELRQLHLL